MNMRFPLVWALSLVSCGLCPGNHALNTRLGIAQVEQAVRLYAVKHGGAYPSTLAAMARYLPAGPVPTDAWGHPLLYHRSPTQGQPPFIILSLGRDGVLGGEGEDADLSNIDGLVVASWPPSEPISAP